MLKKENLYADNSKQKISRFKKNAHVEIMPSADITIDILQNAKDGTYTIKEQKTAKSNDKTYTTLGEGLDRPTVFQMIEKMGVSADAVVERKEDLEDFREPVIMHDQSLKEKEVILSRVSKMEPGDELSISLPDVRSGNGNYVVKGETVKLACVEIDTFQYILSDRYNSRKTEEEKVPKAHQVSGKTLLTHSDSGKIVLQIHPDGFITNEVKRYAPSELSNVKIVKGKYNAQEMSDLKCGKPINLDTVHERNPITDKESYISYVMEHNRPSFTKGKEKAWGTMKMEWDRGFNNTPAWKKLEDLPEKEQRQIQKLSKEEQKEALRKIGYREKDHLEKKIRETQHMVIDASNTDRLEAIITLRRAASDIRVQGKEWRKLARNCDEIASKLPQGNNLNITAASLMDKSESLSLVTEKLKGMYPNIDKGLAKLNTGRTEDVMQSFLSEQGKILAEQKEKVSEKAKKPKKAKGIRRKKSNKSLER